MMHQRWFLCLMCLLALLPLPGLAQEEAQPLVVFVDNSDLLTASVLDSGPDGLTRLESIFVSLGARTARANLNEPLPQDAAVIVFVRTYRRLTLPQAVRLWLQMERGANLLLAFDPPNHIRGDADDQFSPLAPILYENYGARFQDGILIDPTMNQTALRVLSRSLSRVEPYFAPHPLTAPLLTYDLPVLVWGARPVEVDAIGVDTRADTLLFSAPLFVETNRTVFANFNAAPLRLDLGQDRVGAILVGAAAENSRNRTRVILLGDSEALQNGYGLAQFTDGLPVHPANVVLAQRSAAWLLELPEENWLPLPAGFTWHSLDGSESGWDAALPVIPDVTQDDTAAPLDLQYARAFVNDDFLYIHAQTSAPPASGSAMTLDFDLNRDGAADFGIVLTPESAFFRGFNGSETPIPDARLVVGEGLEARLPRRTLIADLPVTNLCIGAGAETPPADCLDQTVTLVSIAARDPETLRYTPDLLVTVEVSGGVSMRTGPGLAYPEVTVIPNQSVLAAVARTTDLKWIQVQNARYAGWVGTGTLRPNGDFESLPIIEIES